MGYTIIKDNEVIARVVWDGITEWQYPFPYDEIVQDDTLQIGMKLIDGVWIMPERPENENIYAMSDEDWAAYIALLNEERSLINGNT